LLMGLLGQREQWLRAIGRIEPLDQSALEATLHALVEEQLKQVEAELRRALSQAGFDEPALMDILREAAASASNLDQTTPYADWSDYHRLPIATQASLTVGACWGLRC